MRKYYFVILMVLILPCMTSTAFADCSLDNDWPEKPCLDMPPYSKSEIVQMWDEYYSMKGQQWMEMKKSEMDYAIENKILQEWLSFGMQSQNFQNYNVYRYYFFNGQAPVVEGFDAEQILRGEDRNPNATLYYPDPTWVILL